MRKEDLWLVAIALAAGVQACSSSDDGSATDGGTNGNDSGGTGGDTFVPPVDAGPVVTYGASYTGGLYHLGPVDYAESAFHNACAPGTKYAPTIQSLEGNLLAGLWNGIPNVAGYCDACIWVTTAKGKSALLRVVTYGDTTTNSIDVSPEAYAILNVGENPRDMTWQFAKCPDSGPVVYEFQTGSNEWWTSLWVRNARVPLAKVAVQSVNHASFIELQRGTDGTLTDVSGFGNGPFTIQLTGIDGSTITDSFAWPSSGIAGATLSGAKNFD